MTDFVKAIAPVWTPHAGQAAYLSSNARIRVLACGRRWGKTDVCAVEILRSLVQGDAGRHLLVAPTLDQAAILFDRLIELLVKLKPIWPFGEFPDVFHIKRTPYPRLKFGEHTVSARSGHIGRSLRGNEARHIVVDEAAYVPEELVTEIAMPMLATTNGALTMISTPNGKNHFWRFFQLGKGRKHSVWSRSAPSKESPFVSAQFLALQRQLISERAYRTEYEAEFHDSEGQVFRTESIEKSIVAQLPKIEDAPIWIGVDWARYTDYTAVAVASGFRQRAQVWEVQRFQGESWSHQLQRVVEVIQRYPGASVRCDATGMGDPLLEMLQVRLPNRRIEGFVFTMSSKSALVDQLAWMFENEALKMEPHPDLIRELQHFESSLSHSGNVKLGASSGFHDDTVMALGLACQGLRQEYEPKIQLGGERRFSRCQSQVRNEMGPQGRLERK